ncbi:MAG: glycosyltransferase [Synergistota bacterium]|nr:glycosyltransferase [Synergistota bacterium]
METYILAFIAEHIYPLLEDGTWPFLLKFMPFVLFFELPLSLLVMMGVIKYSVMRRYEGERRPYFPPVSCIITCYSEGRDIQQTIKSLAEQIYPGKIEILAMIDGAAKNVKTYDAAMQMYHYVSDFENRKLVVVPKWQRGGRVSSLNTGLNFASGEIIMALDGDTSFDNNMVERATRHFEDPGVSAVSGCLRVKNSEVSLAATLQAIEYFVSIQSSKTGLSSFNLVNNISGAFGVFRKSVLELVGGWDAGTAEDLDMTLRIKNYFGRYKKKFRIIFDPEAIGHTEAPDTFRGFFKQRLRWDGDLSFLYFRKHRPSFKPQLLGWPNFLMILFNGLFSQIVMPFVIFVYMIWLFVKFPIEYSATMLFIVYLFYMLLLIIMYLVFVACLSERPKEDLSRLCFLLLMPLFSFAARINSLFATIWEVTAKGHKDTAMAPWWVTKKSKF